MNDNGYVYVLINPSMPNLVKIGKTTREPKERAKELSSTTGVPVPFIVVYDEFFENCSKAEQYIHTLLADGGFRVSTNREFFEISVKEAIDAVMQTKEYFGEYVNIAQIEYDKSIERLSYLLYKKVDKGKELTDEEEAELSSLSANLKGVKIPNYEDLWKTPPTGLNDKELQKFNNALATYKAYKFLIMPDEIAGDEFFIDIMKELSDEIKNKTIAEQKNIMIDIRQNYFKLGE